MRRGLLIISILLLLTGTLPTPVQAVTPNCTLCILEFQVQGQHGEEDQDFVIVANLSAAKITSSSIQLRYYNSVGLLSDTLGIGTFEVGQIKVYANDSLRGLNAGATKLTLPLYSGGGSLQIARTSGATTTIYDKVGWGSTALYEATPLAVVGAGMTAARQNHSGNVQDTDNNALDFQVARPTCRGADISELQPFVTDSSGQAIDAWVELSGTTDEKGDCLLLTAAGDSYTIPGAVMPGVGEITLIDHALDDADQVVPLHLGDASGQVWLAGVSVYGDASGNGLRLPLITQPYSNLEKGQSWAAVDGIWRRTYQPTPSETPNVFQGSANLFDDDPAACNTVRISELLPNPIGDDTGHEWVELTNEGDTPASLAHCVLDIGGTVYYFLPDDVLGAGEWRAVYGAYDADQSPKAFSLRNSGDNAVLLSRVRADGTTETLQSFVYIDSPEGQSWARFAEGWRWLAMPTPNLDNAAIVATDDTTPTEFPATQPEVPGTEDTPAPSAPLLITELLPNPAAPQTDDADEFVEIYNPTDQPVNLANYKIQTGNSYSYSYTFTTQTLAPKSYLTVTSGNSSISLSNTAGRARLLGPDDQTISETVPYTDAPEGQSWAIVDGTWQWTGSVTSGADNIITVPVVASLAKASTAKKAATAKTTKAAAAKAPAKKAAAKKSAKTATTKPAAGSAAIAATAPPLHAMVLAGVGLLAVLYAAYEYRHDIANRIYQLRRYRAARRANRPTPAGE